MALTEPLSEAAVEAVAQAIFASTGATVFEAYSRFDAEPRRFADAAELCAHAAQHRGPPPRDSIQLIAYYPDMGGRLVQRKILLDPDKVASHTHRYTFDGWGLVSVYLHLAGKSVIGSFVSANSRKRAEKWAPTITDWDPPDAWNWKAVASHERRIARALRDAVAATPPPGTNAHG